MSEVKLTQTRGVFKVIGKVTRIDRDGAFKEEDQKNESNKNFGKLYRTLNFGVKTSETNEITVGSFDYEPEEVFMWNSEKKKEDESYKGDRIPFGKWEQQQDELREQGFAVLQSRIGLDYGEDGKLKTKGLPRYVAAQEIYNNINNGDSVVVEGSIRYSRYKNKEGEWKEQKNYTIEKLFRVKDIDFDAEKFEEVSYFEQQMVFVGADIDKEEGKAYITGRIIDFTGKYEDVQFIVNFADGEGGYDPSMVKLAEAFAKKFKFGDVLKVFGDTLNKVVTQKVEEEDNNDEEDDLLSQLGGRSKPKHAQSYSLRSYITEMQIHGVDEWEKGVYTDDDFVDNGLIEEDKKDLSDELGGKSKPKGKNPFDIDDEDGADSISADDLPF